MHRNHPAHATAIVDERGVVLLVHIGHDAEHPRPDNNQRKHSAKRDVIRKTSMTSVPMTLSTTSVAARGRRFRSLLLPPPLLPLPPQRGPRVGRPGGELLEPARSDCISSALSFASSRSSNSFCRSSSSLCLKAAEVRYWSEKESTASPAAPASSGRASDGTGAATFPSVTAPPLRLRLRQDAGPPCTERRLCP